MKEITRHLLGDYKRITQFMNNVESGQRMAHREAKQAYDCQKILTAARCLLDEAINDNTDDNVIEVYQSLVAIAEEAFEFAIAWYDEAVEDIPTPQTVL